MYQVSKFFVSYQLNENEVLIYSTLTTSIIVLEYKIYVDIFENGNIKKYPEYISELLEMGMIYKTEEDENKKLQDIRQKLIDEERGMKSITIAPTMSCNARCYYCFENGSTKGNMSYEVAKQLVKFIDKKWFEGGLFGDLVEDNGDVYELAQVGDARLRKPVWNSKTCIGCNLCLNNCPQKAIVENDKMYKSLDEKCIGCGICEAVCPKLSWSMF